MSKRNFPIDRKGRFHDRSYSRERFGGARNSGNHISTTKSPREKGFSCQKKVKFAKEIDSPTSCRLETSSIPLERKEAVTHANHPKTSEYALFKKLKEDAGQRCHSNNLQKDACILKKPESNDCLRDRHPISSASTSNQLQGDAETFQPQDMFVHEGFGCQKKVKFTAKDIDSTVSSRLEVSPIPLERKEFATYGNHPKTSEYAFFKKLKEAAGQRCHSNSLPKDAYLVKKPESNDCLRERTNYARSSSKCFNHPTPTENIPTVNFDLFPSPTGGALKKPDRYPISSTSMQKKLQGYDDSFQSQDTLLHEGTQYVQGKIFFKKRQKLRQWVADASFPDVDELCSKGHDIVSMLLGRLVSHSNNGNKYYYPNSGKVVTTSRHDFLVSQESDVQFKEHLQIHKKKFLELDSSLSSPMFHGSNERIISYADFPAYHSHKFQSPYNITEPESDIQFKEHHQIPKEKLLELESSSYSSDDLPSPLFHRSDERIISFSDFPICHCHNFHPPYSITEPECNFGGTASFSANSDTSSGFLFNEQELKSLAWNHFQERGKHGREPNPLLLKNDFVSTTDETSIPMNHSNEKLLMGPASLTSLGNCEEQLLNNILGAHRLCSSSILPNQPPVFNSMLDSSLYQENRFGKYVYEDLDTDFNHNFFSLSYKDYLKLSEDYRSDHSRVRDSIYLSPYQHLFRGTVSSDFHHHADADTEAWLSCSPDFISGRRCISLAGPHQEHQNPNYGILQLALRESVSDLFQIKDNYKQDRDGGNDGELLYQLGEDVLEICNSSFLHISMQRDKGFPLLLYGSEYISEEEQTHY